MQSARVFIRAVSFPGATDAVHIPGNRVHQHGDHLQCHSQGGHRPSDHAHTEILLLGYQPPGSQRSRAQRLRWGCSQGTKTAGVWGSRCCQVIHRLCGFCLSVSTKRSTLSIFFFSCFIPPMFSDGPRPSQKEILSLRAFLLLFVKQLIMKVRSWRSSQRTPNKTELIETSGSAHF